VIALRSSRGALASTVMMLALAAADMAAQACIGRPTLGVTNVGTVGAGVAFLRGGRSYGVDGTLGNRLFGLGSLDYYDYDDVSFSLKAVTAAAGYQLSTESEESVCPILLATHNVGFERNGVDMSATELAPGLSLAVMAEMSPTVRVGLFGQGAFVYTRVHADADVLGDESRNETAGVFGLGLTLISNDRWSFSPSVSFPVGVENADTVLGLSLAMALRR
jgi:hypothetical protein